MTYEDALNGCEEISRGQKRDVAHHSAYTSTSTLRAPAGVVIGVAITMVQTWHFMLLSTDGLVPRCRYVQVATPAKVREPEASSNCIYASQQGGRQAELATIMFTTGLTMWRACAYLCGQWSCAWLLMQCPFRRLQQSALCKAAPVSAKKHPSSVQALLYSVINTTSCSRSTLMAKVSNGSTAKDVAFKCGWLTGSMWMVASLS